MGSNPPPNIALPFVTQQEALAALGLKDAGMNLPPPCLDCGRQCVWVWEHHTPVCPKCRLEECRRLRTDVWTLRKALEQCWNLIRRDVQPGDAEETIDTYIGKIKKAGAAAKTALEITKSNA